MKELLDDIERWEASGQQVALARVVGVRGSGPRPPGAAMAVSESGEVAGSVSGGCVEGAVVSEAIEVLASGRAKQCTFGYSDDEAFAVGLTCGGTIHVFVQPSAADVADQTARRALREGRPVALATVIGGEPMGATMAVTPEGREGSLGNEDLDRIVARDALGALDAGRSATWEYGPCGEARQSEVTVFVDVFAPPARMVVFGAVDFTAALVRVAKVLGYHVTVCDARPVFATIARFPEADEVVVDWPDRYLAKVADSLGPRDAVCVLTHDHKFDVPALVGAVSSGAGYIGAMGSRRTHGERVRRLREAGLTDEQLGRIMAPIGLDIGARTPEETAVSVCAEIIALRTGTPRASLRDGQGPIHRLDPAAAVDGVG